jgi:prophage regulatory protein
MISTDTLPQEGFVRLKQVLQVIPVSSGTWWTGVKAGKFPKPLKLGTKTTVWRVEDIRKFIEELQ